MTPMMMAMMMGNSARHYLNKVKDTQVANLIGYWPLNGNANDYSGRGFHGTPANVTWGDGIGDGGQGGVFAGNGYVNVFSAALAAAFSPLEGTLFSWFRVSAVGDWSDSAYRDVAVFFADANNMAVITKRSTANQLALYYAAGGTVSSNNRVMDPASPTDWCWGAITWNKAFDRVIIYSIGVGAAVTKTALGVWSGSLTRALIGADTTTTQFWKGSIAHVALWNAELSAAQITSLATFTPPF
jgi:hypothetical protein